MVTSAYLRLTFGFFLTALALVTHMKFPSVSQQLEKCLSAKAGPPSEGKNNRECRSPFALRMRPAI